MSLVKAVKAAVVQAESYWFDVRWRVHTRAYMPDVETTGDKDHYAYLPIRPPAARALLKQLPVAEHGAYTFIDFGSGAGRMLLLAARLPFRAVYGVEYDSALHRRALRNMEAARARRRCSDVQCFHMDAGDYELPAGNLVLYFFNPFSERIMSRVLERLRCALEQQQPREVVVAICYPEVRDLTKLVPQLRFVLEKGSVCVYRAASAPAAAVRASLR